MADDTNPIPPPPLDGKARRRLNLRPPFRPGSPGPNPTGYNGRDKNKIVVDFLEAFDPKDPSKRPRIMVLLESMYVRARLGHAVALKYLGEQYTGKAKTAEKIIPSTHVDPQASLLDVAMQIYRARLSAGEMTETELTEMVRVLLAAEKDKALIFLKALGSKIQTLQNAQIERLLGAYEADPAKFLGFASAKVPEPEPDVLDVSPSVPLAEQAPEMARAAETAIAFGRGAEPVASTIPSARGNNSAPTADATAGTTPDVASNFAAWVSDPDDEDDE
jgi:hypothetical protein